MGEKKLKRECCIAKIFSTNENKNSEFDGNSMRRSVRRIVKVEDSNFRCLQILKFNVLGKNNMKIFEKICF